MAALTIPLALTDALQSVLLVGATVFTVHIAISLYHWLRESLDGGLQYDSQGFDPDEDYIDPDDFEGADELREQYYAEHPEEREGA